MTEIHIHISSGQGPEECRWVVGQVARAFAREAASLGVGYELLDAAAGNPASLLVRITGEGAEAFARGRTGTVLWAGLSPFRANHKRRNWFIGVTRVPPAEELPELNDTDIDYQATRASGPGGQHVNKTDSAVRAVHRPTGLVAFAQDQRSQHANRKLARLRLALLLIERREASDRSSRRDEWSRNHQLERGNPVRTYAGPKFELKAGR